MAGRNWGGNVEFGARRVLRPRSVDELRDAFDGWLATVPEAVRGWELEPYEGPLAVPGGHNRENAACALEALRRAGGVQSRAAEILGMSFRSFRYYAKKYNLT